MESNIIHLHCIEAQIKEFVGEHPHTFFNRRGKHDEKYDKVGMLISHRHIILNRMFMATEDKVHRLEN